MGNHPVNLALRFLLEIAALFALSYWGWTRNEGLLRFVLGFGLPLLAGALWGTFRVPGDASSSGEAPVAVPGIVRLALELTLFGLAVGALYASGRDSWGLVLAALVLIHYLASYDRVLWLIRGER